MSVCLLCCIALAGPDELAPAEEVCAWDREAGVKLRMGTSGPSARKAISVITMFRNTLKKSSGEVAMGKSQLPG